MDNKKITRFGLIRHAETHWNRDKIIQGQRDSGLTAKGKKDADRWGQRLRRFTWTRMIASDLGRALETANRINRHLKIPFESDLRLREQDWGQWAGQPVAEVAAHGLKTLDEPKRSGWGFCPPEGEDRLSVWQRSQQALVAAANKYPADTILIVTHEGVIKSLIYRLFHRSYLPAEPALIKSLHLHWLMVGKNGLQVEKINALALS
jgi:probable phosphoglycerate mutase